MEIKIEPGLIFYAIQHIEGTLYAIFGMTNDGKFVRGIINLE